MAAGCCVAAAPASASPAYAGLVVGAVVTMAALAYYVRDPLRGVVAYLGFLVIQPALAASVGYTTTLGRIVREADKFIALAMLVLVMTMEHGRATHRTISRFLVGGLLFAAAGVVSGLAQHVAPNVVAIGAWLQLKWWVLLAIALAMPWTERDAWRVFNATMRAGLVLVGAGVLDLLDQHGLRGFLHTDVVSVTLDARHTHAVQGLFTTPGHYSIVMSMLMAIALAAAFTGHEPRRHVWLALVFGVMALLSLRASAVAAIAMATFVVWMLATRSFEGRVLGVIAVAVLSLVLVVTFHSEIASRQAAYATSSSARSLLYTTSIKIADQHFPLGSGFGTFASGESRLHYSPVYAEYGLSRTYGLSPVYPGFIDDTMWPAIVGEAGYLGLAAVIGGLVVVGGELLRRSRSGDGPARTFAIAATGVLVVAMVNSAANPVMFDGIDSLLFAVVAAPALLLPSKSRRLISERLSPSTV